MRIIAAVLACVAAFAAPALAQPFEEPSDVLAAFYAPYLRDDIPENEEQYRSDYLNGLYEADYANTPDGEMGAIEFDPYVDGQDFVIEDLEIGEPMVRGDKARVVVEFTNMGEPRRITYDLVYENGGWLINDLANEDAEYPYRLSEIFEEAKQYW